MVKRYLSRLYDSILSRGYIEIEDLDIDDELSTQRTTQGIITGQLRFYDGSLLDFDEVVALHNARIIRLRYAYHYQAPSGELIFRYDNLPHHPQIETYPHHKHVGNKVLPAQPPDLNDVLREIEHLIYGR